MADDAKAAEDKRRAKQAENNAKAAEVMEKSTPFPTQEQVDQAKLGLLNTDNLQAPDQPEMPPLHEQRDDKAAAKPAARPAPTRSTTL